MNKKLADQMQFYQGKKMEKRKWIQHSYQPTIAIIDGLCYKME